MPDTPKPEPKFRPTANPELARAMHGIGSSSATDPHDSRPNRQRTRADVKRAAIAEQKPRRRGDLT